MKKSPRFYSWEPAGPRAFFYYLEIAKGLRQYRAFWRRIDAEAREIEEQRSRALFQYMATAGYKMKVKSATLVEIS